MANNLKVVMRYSSHQRSKGFTLIELIIVIIVLGIIAVTASAKYNDMSEEAHIAAVQGIATAFKSGVDLTRTKFLLGGYSTRVQNLPGYGDGNVDTNNIGYPIGIDKGSLNENVGRGNAGCVGIWNGIMVAAPGVSHNNDNESFRSYRHDSNRMCSYVYRDAGDTAGRNNAQIVIRYDSRDGSVQVCGRSDLLDDC